MAQQPLAVDRLPAEFPRSLSDRPWYVRAAVHTGRFFRAKPLGGIGVALIVLLVVVAVFREQLSRYDPQQVFQVPNPSYDAELAEQALDNPSVKLLHPPEKFEPTTLARNLGPSAEHWLGTDNNGRDLFARLVWGSRVSLYVGIGASALAVILGSVFGIVSAYFGGWVDMLMQRFADSLQAFPPLILLLLMIQVIDTPNLTLIIVALGIVGVAPVIRIVRSTVLAVREEVYVTAAITIGAGDLRIMFRHILPNIVAPIIVVFTTSIGLYILAEASLSFLGYGDPREISWGKMVNEGRVLTSAAPNVALVSGLAITLVVLAFNLAGDALRDVLDPRLRGRSGRAGF